MQCLNQRKTVCLSTALFIRKCDKTAMFCRNIIEHSLFDLQGQIEGVVISAASSKMRKLALTLKGWHRSNTVPCESHVFSDTVLCESHGFLMVPSRVLEVNYFEVARLV